MDSRKMLDEHRMQMLEAWMNSTKFDIPRLGECQILEVIKRDESGYSFDLLVLDKHNMQQRVYLDTRAMNVTTVMDPELHFITTDTRDGVFDTIGPVNSEELDRFFSAVPEEWKQHLKVGLLAKPFWPDGKINLERTDSGRFICAM